MNINGIVTESKKTEWSFTIPFAANRFPTTIAGIEINTPKNNDPKKKMRMFIFITVQCKLNH